MTGAPWLQLAPLDARVLRATDAYRERTAERVARMAGCSEEEVRRSLKRSARQADDRARWPPSVRLASHPPR